jgi:hypothetical protein
MGGALVNIGGKVRFLSNSMTVRRQKVYAERKFDFELPQGNPVTREKAFQYCCSLNMSLLKELDFASLKTIISTWHAPLRKRFSWAQTFVHLKNSASWSKMVYADTHHTVENGALVERFCDSTDAIITYFPNDTINTVLKVPTYIHISYFITGSHAKEPSFESLLNSIVTKFDSFVCDYVWRFNQLMYSTTNYLWFVHYSSVCILSPSM